MVRPVRLGLRDRKARPAKLGRPVQMELPGLTELTVLQVRRGQTGPMAHKASKGSKVHPVLRVLTERMGRRVSKAYKVSKDHPGFPVHRELLERTARME